MDSKAKWDAIEVAVSAQPASLGLFHFTMSAETNAQDTVYAEKSAPESEYHAICIDSLGSLLAYSDNKAAQDFFWALGVKF